MVSKLRFSLEAHRRSGVPTPVLEVFFPIVGVCSGVIAVRALHVLAYLLSC